MSPRLGPFFAHHRELFVVPIEALGPAGCDPELASWLTRERGLEPGFFGRFDAAFARYHARTTALFARAPETWPAARITHVCVVQDPAGTRPYYQPIPGASWLVYASDFEEETGSVELGAYAFAVAERLGLVQKPSAALLHTLSWFLTMTPQEREDFAAGARRATRPDAAAYRAIADALELVTSLGHDHLHPEAAHRGPQYARIDGANVIVEKARVPALRALVARFDEASQGVARRHLDRASGGDGDEARARLLDWLRDAVPPVLLFGEGGAIVWDPDAPGDVDALARALSTAGPRPLESLREDLALVADRTRDLLGALDEPEALAPPTDALDQEGGVWIHPRKLVAYALAQPGLDAREEPAPPFHRLLLGARVTHEWGHLAVDAGYVPVRHEDALEKELAALRRLFQAIVDEAPGPHQATARADFDDLRRQGGSFVGVVHDRVDDFRANLLMKLLSPTAELEAYVRVNVRTLLFEPGGPYRRLARYAYEYQYLSLARIDDPWRYFVASTFFEEQFLRTGIVTASRARELFETVGRLFAAYEVDTARVRARGAPPVRSEGP